MDNAVAMKVSNQFQIVFILVGLASSGCAFPGGHATKSADPLVKQAQDSEVVPAGGESARRFSKSAISDAEMLGGQGFQQYRDSLVP